MNNSPLTIMSANPAVSIVNGSAVTTSLAVSQYFYKRHDNILRALAGLECSPKFTKLNFEVCHKNNELQNGKPLKYYQMTKDGFVFLVMGFTGKKAAAFKEAYIAEFNRMEASLRETAKSLPEKITLDQQTLIKELVKSRAEALPKDKRAKAAITMWSALKSHFGMTYKEIPEQQFTEAVSLVARLPLEGELLAPAKEPKHEEAYITNLHCLMHNFRRIDEIWRSHLLPALAKLDSKLVSKLYDRFNDSMCILPGLEERFGKFIPPAQRLK